MKKQILNTSGLFILALSLTFTGCKKEDKDTTNPVVTMNGPATMYAQQNKTYSEPSASATDDTDGSINVNISGTVNTAVVGTYIVTYTAKDEAGNTGTATRTVHVVNFDGNYTLVQSGCTDPGGNGTGTAIVSASGTTAANRIDIQNFGLYSAVVANAIFSGNNISVARQASATGTAGDMIEGSGTITGTGTATDPLKFVMQIKETDNAGVVFNTGTATFTHN
ncbi:MAG: pesticidal crystal protein Cry22Aa [Bacteroidetes bacterium]|nr:pesticidal crystal protein Cry22Aa [Bacteroidota bacterium]